MSSQSRVEEFRKRKLSTQQLRSHDWPVLPAPSSLELNHNKTPIDEVEISTDSDGGRDGVENTEGVSEKKLRRTRNNEKLIVESGDVNRVCSSPEPETMNDVGQRQAVRSESRSIDAQAYTPLSFVYFSQQEHSFRHSIVLEESALFLSSIIFPFVKSCERIMKIAVLEASVLRSKLVDARRSFSKDIAVDSPESKALGVVLQQQLHEQQLRSQHELERANQRREREVSILQEGYLHQIQCLEEQIKLLKANGSKVSYIETSIRDIERSVPRLGSISPKMKGGLRRRGDEINASNGSPTGAKLMRDNISQRPHGSQIFSPPSTPCPSSNPRHSTVVASLDGCSWRSIYLVVAASGQCSYSESISEESIPLLTLDEVISVRTGSSKHLQRPLLLSILFRNRQLDIALADKSEREFWRQAFKIRKQAPPPALLEIVNELAHVSEQSARNAADSLASTPTVSSAHPLVTADERENPTLKKWLESQADNVRRGNLDPDNLSLNNASEGEEVKNDSGETLKKRPTFSSSPVPTRPPLGSSYPRDLGGVATMSTSSRDRLPPLAPQHKKRSTVSGSASTADSLTEDENIDSVQSVIPSQHLDDAIVPVSPSHSSEDDVASAPSTEESINLSPELSPIAPNGVPQEEI